ncbi:hypothetical protein FB382_000814 [Nocardioides ginsengisegetis]|uniref:Uncharacterized protein n=1 Tax=Nocardioides ginsengisegetis TaxID=661491 RepID=A0A7W3IXN2_9ACTN|nr:hypothetical protein [Nocardioides ginsengisegetis]MBA8802523.1 hypothetical protein [Nocardioides ginsengisegetis]
MTCDLCGLTPTDEVQHRQWHGDLTASQRLGAAARGTYTCDRCFAQVKRAHRDAHTHWHAVLIELARAVDRSHHTRA